MAFTDTKPKRAGVIQFVYYPQDAEYIQKFINDGFTISSLFRQWLREKGREAYPETPEYAKALALRAELAKKKIDSVEEIKAMTDEEYAVKVLKCKIVDDKAVFRDMRGNDWDRPLKGIKAITPENNEDVQIHVQIMDGTVLMWNGVPPTEAEWEIIKKGW